MENSRSKICLLSLFLIGISLATFWKVKGCPFIILDDPSYILGNPEIRGGLTWHGVQWALGADLFFNSPFVDYWQPVTCLSRLLDVQLFGLNPAGHHLMNLFIHILNTLLLFHLLRKMTCPGQGRGTGFTGRSFMVAALFAVHPLRVEAVAWVTERKELLGGTFWMLTLWAYWKYTHARRSTLDARRAGPGWYGLTLLFFILGLMSKPMIITLPLVLLLLDYWPLRRCGPAMQNSKLEMRNLILEKLPFLTLSLLSILITLRVERTGYRAYPSIGAGIENAVISYGFHLKKAIFPHPLAIFYSRPLDPYPPEVFAGSLLLLLVPSLLVTRYFRSKPYLSTGWLWFLVTLGPVVGLNDMVGADRFTYLPLVGVFIALVWGMAEWGTAWKWKTGFLKAGGGLLIGACMATSVNQLKYWRDSHALFNHAAQVTQESYIVHDNLGSLLLLMGKADEAIPHFRFDLLIYPDSPQINDSLGKALVATGRVQPGIEHFKRAIKVDPSLADAWLNLGDGLAASGQPAEAVACYQRVLKLDPENSRAENNLGLVLGSRGKWDDAMGHFLKALQGNPSYSKAHYNLGICLAHKKKYAEAENHLKTALRLDPEMKEARSALAKIKSRPHD